MIREATPAGGIRATPNPGDQERKPSSGSRESKATEKVNILLVDDKPARLLSYEAILSELGENLIQATSGTEALRRVLEMEFAVILLDIYMPGLDGFETAALIHQHPRYERTPIIFVTGAQVNDLDRLKSYELGAVDYVSVPVVPEILRSKVGVLVELYRKRRELQVANASLERANAELAAANELLQAEQTVKLRQLNENLELANRELARTNSNLHAEIGERRRAEESMRFLAETIPSIVWTATPDGAISYANKRWLDHCVAPPSTPGPWPELAIHPDDREQFNAQWSVLVAGGRSFEIEVRLRDSEGLFRWFITRAVPWRASDGRVLSWFGVTTDIHEQKQLQEQLRAADRRKDEFLATLAHELRNPLAPLHNAAHILKVAAHDLASVRQAQGIMDRQLGQMVRLVNDLLDVSRITRGKLELRRQRVSLDEVLAAAVETARPQIEALGHHLTVDVRSEGVWLDADRARLAQVFGNLLNNACKFTDRGGEITLSADSLDGVVQLSVSDNGIGIAPELLSQVFDLFVQAGHARERSPEGLGIGLTLVRRLVDLHGGSVTVSSDGLGKGTEFVVRLPIASPPSGPSPDTAGAGSGELLPALDVELRVMVVDDNRDAADMLSASLAHMGQQVRCVYDPATAASVALAFRPHLVFLDLGMPMVSGYEVAQQIRALALEQQPRLVALTGWGQDEDRRRTRRAGFDEHWVKPADIGRIARLCRELGYNAATGRPLAT